MRGRGPFGTGTVLAFAVLSSALNAQGVDWSTAPDVEPPRPFVPPPMEEHRLSNGLRVYLVSRADVPLVQVNVLMRTGAIHEPPSKAGLAQLTASLMRSAAGGRSGAAISRDVQFLGAALSTHATAHSIEAHLRTPLSSLNAALPLLAAAVLAPAFDESAFETLQQRWADVLARRSSNSVEVSNALFRRALFGEHAYGRFPSGTSEGMRAITLEDVRAFHAAALHPQRSAVVVVGGVDMSVLLPQLEALFGASWPAREVSARSNDVPPAPAVPGLYIVDSRNAAQANIRIAQRAPAHTDPDHAAFAVLNFVLGGSTTSRLGAYLRETLGVTYEARSDFTSLPEGGFLVAWSNVETDAVAVAVQAMMRELSQLRENISAEEVTIAREHLMMSYPESFATIGGVARTVGDLLIGGLPTRGMQQYAERIASIAVDDVRRVARERIDMSQLVVVIIGDLARIRGDLPALGLGPPVELTPDEALRITPLGMTR